MAQEALGGSALEHGPTLSLCALRQPDLPQAGGPPATLGGRTDASRVPGPDLSTFHPPMPSRCLVAHGASLDGQHQRGDCTPALQGLAPAQPMRHRGRRWAGSRAGGWGGSRRPLALLLAALCLRPLPTASINRWREALGAPWPTPAARLRPLLVLAPAPEGPLAGSSSFGPAPGVRGVQDEPDRLRMTQEAAAEHGDAAKPCLPHRKDRGRTGPAACAEDSHRCTAARTAVSPQARLQADHCHTGTPLWEPRNKSLRSDRRPGKTRGADKKAALLLAGATPRGQWRGSRLTKPAHRAVEATQAMAARPREEAGGGPSFRSLLRPRVPLFAQAPREAQAERTLHQRRKASQAMGDHHLEKRPQGFDDPWGQSPARSAEHGQGAASAWVALRVGEASATQTGEKPRRDPVCSNPATVYSDLAGDAVPLPRRCRV